MLIYILHLEMILWKKWNSQIGERGFYQTVCMRSNHIVCFCHQKVSWRQKKSNHFTGQMTVPVLKVTFLLHLYQINKHRVELFFECLKAWMRFWLWFWNTSLVRVYIIDSTQFFLCLLTFEYLILNETIKCWFDK